MDTFRINDSHYTTFLALAERSTCLGKLRWHGTFYRSCTKAGPIGCRSAGIRWETNRKREKKAESNCELLVPRCNGKNVKWSVRSISLRNRNFLCQFRNQRPKRHKNRWCSHCIAEKMVLTTRPTVATAQGTKLKPVHHSLVFRECNISKRSSTGVNLQPIYESTSTYFSEFYFVIPCSMTQFG